VELVKKNIRNYLPFLIFVEKGVDFGAIDLLSFKRILPSQSKIVHLNPDDPFGFFNAGWDKFVSSIPYYDLHFVPKAKNVDEYINYSARSVHVFDRSFDPNYHRAISLTESDIKKYQCDVGFIGSYAKKREQVIYEMVLGGVEVAIWGAGWSQGIYWNTLRNYWRGGTQTGENYIKAICGMKIALHFVRHENRDLHDSRTFEIPACGSFMLAERTDDHERFFAEDKEVVLFDSAEDCIDKCIFYLTNEEERLQISIAGEQRVLGSNYDYTSRLKEMLGVILND
tara:strand:- start:14244 stop:15092 length:849 start_codon:yes stop_codon:yes gene_type:complete